MGKPISTRRARRLREWVKVVSRPHPVPEEVRERIRKEQEEHEESMRWLTSSPWRG